MQISSIRTICTAELAPMTDLVYPVTGFQVVFIYSMPDRVDKLNSLV